MHLFFLSSSFFLNHFGLKSLSFFDTSFVGLLNSKKLFNFFVSFATKKQRKRKREEKRREEKRREEKRREEKRNGEEKTEKFG